MNDFYVTLPSQYSKANYVTKLTKSMKLEGEWEVGLCEISYTYAWYNLFNDEVITIISHNKGIKETNFTINKGFYSINELINSINSIAKNQKITKRYINVDHFPKLFINSDDSLDKVRITSGLFKKKLIWLKFSENLSNILGLDKKRYDNYIDEFFKIYEEKYRKEVLPVDFDADYIGEHEYLDYYYPEKTYDITSGYHTLFLYCDIIEPILVGDSFTKLLRIVDIPSGKEYGDQVHLRYTNIQYKKLEIKEFDHIEIRIADDAGEDIQFSSTSKIIVKLHFRKVNKNNENK